MGRCSEAAFLLIAKIQLLFIMPAIDFSMFDLLFIRIRSWCRILLTYLSILLFLHMRPTVAAFSRFHGAMWASVGSWRSCGSASQHFPEALAVVFLFNSGHVVQSR